MTVETKEFHSPEEARHRLGLGKNAMYQALKRGEIPGAIKIGDRYFIPKLAIDKMAGKVG